MRFILHIGINKTGTSSLQRTLSNNADALRALDICYPETGRGGGAAHHDLSRALKGMPAERFGLPPAWREAFLAEAESCATCVVSSEDFATMPDPAKAATLFPPGETQVVVYLREHLRHLASWYQQAIHSRAVCLDFDEFARNYRKDFHPVLDRWKQVFGARNLLVRQYDRATLEDGDIVRDFLAHAIPEAQGKLTPVPGEANPSLAGNLLFAKLLLNLTQPQDLAQGRTLTELAALTKLDASFRGSVPVAAETVARLRRLTRPDREALARDHGFRFEPPMGAIDGPAYPDLTRLRDDLELLRDGARKRGFQVTRLIDRLLDAFAPAA